MNQYRFYHITEAPVRIFGLHVADRDKRQYYRLPVDIIGKMPRYEFLGRRATGGRARFATDSPTIMVRMTLACTKEDVNIPLSGSAGADIYQGTGEDSVFLGYIAPKIHTADEITVEKEFAKAPGMEVITINFPRNDLLLDMEIGIEEGSVIQEAPDYRIKAPIIYYGSSITEGGCASRAGNAYTSIVSRWLDADYYNFGFSNSARGEKVFAEFIAGLGKKSAFVYDYDHNAPDASHLEQTHEAFFRIVRDADPELPVIMMSMPDVDSDREEAERRKKIVYRTYENAVAAGDKNVYFLDGAEFFGEYGRQECTVDGAHPNALGFMRMADKVYPLMKKIFAQQERPD